MTDLKILAHHIRKGDLVSMRRKLSDPELGDIISAEYIAASDGDACLGPELAASASYQLLERLAVST